MIANNRGIDTQFIENRGHVLECVNKYTINNINWGKGNQFGTLPLVMVDVTEGLNTSPLNRTNGFKSAKLFTAEANLYSN
jgi:hypothetical protein